MTPAKKWASLLLLGIIFLSFSACKAGGGCGCPKFSLESKANF